MDVNYKFDVVFVVCNMDHDDLVLHRHLDNYRDFCIDECHVINSFQEWHFDNFDSWKLVYRCSHSCFRDDDVCLNFDVDLHSALTPFHCYFHCTSVCLT